MSRLNSKKQKRIIREIRMRDHSMCWFCGGVVCDGPIIGSSLEHLIPVAHGGTNQQRNLALAHRKCNELAGDMPLPHKLNIKLAGGYW